MQAGARLTHRGQRVCQVAGSNGTKICTYAMQGCQVQRHSQQQLPGQLLHVLAALQGGSNSGPTADAFCGVVSHLLPTFHTGTGVEADFGKVKMLEGTGLLSLRN